MTGINGIYDEVSPGTGYTRQWRNRNGLSWLSQCPSTVVFITDVPDRGESGKPVRRVVWSLEKEERAYIVAASLLAADKSLVHRAGPLCSREPARGSWWTGAPPGRASPNGQRIIPAELVGRSFDRLGMTIRGRCGRPSEASKQRVMTALRGGAKDFIEKPFSLDEVLKRVQAVLLQQKTTHAYLTGLGLGGASDTAPRMI